MKRDVGRYYILHWGGGEIIISSDMARDIDWLKNKDRIIVEHDKEKKELKLTKL